MKNRMGLALCLVFFVLLAAACEAGPGQDQARPESSTVRPQPEPGDRIVLGSLGDAVNLIPPLASDIVSHDIADLIYLAPLKYDKDLRLRPWAAESFETLEQGRLLRFTLRRGLTWEDGRELTARDVEFTYHVMIDPRTPTPYAQDFKEVKDFKVLDSHRFEVRYERPFVKALSSWTSAILPEHALAGQDLLATPLARKPLGAGPFRLTQWKAGAMLRLGAREGFFEGGPYLKEIVTRVIPDPSTMFLELKTGGLDMMFLSPQQYLSRRAGGRWVRDYRAYEYPASVYVYLGYNLANPLFSDKRTRQALAMGIDKSEIVKAALLGQGAPTIGPYRPDSWPYNHDLVDYPFDPARAKALLAEVGWTPRPGDGVLVKDGAAFSFTILTNQGNETRLKAATIMQRRLSELGVEVRVRSLEWAALIKEFIDKGRFEALLLGWTIPPDPDSYDVWHSSRAVPGGLNFIGYKNPEVDRLLEAARTVFDQDARKRYYDQFQALLHEDQPYCFLFTPFELPAVQARFQGAEPAPAGIKYNLHQWWVPKGRQRAALTP